MEKLIAVRPVRFDRDYHIGETIPSIAVNPKSVKRLIETGRIQRIDERDSGASDRETEDFVAQLEELLSVDYEGGAVPEMAQRKAAIRECVTKLLEAATAVEDNAQEGQIGINPKPDNEAGPTGDAMSPGGDTSAAAPANLDTACPVCGKICGTKAALTSHMRAKHPDYEK